ncbi:MAG: polysaccharide pyruvyl transferase CsaB [Oscillospiraceae bacterium]|nr:polysaccharide pyruvyl transferase CsaB [Oscillospiraceae bacterium]MCI8715787.1 polysaccharide pyruvyl transferase CsaB [Oscillospiraceae bacterium]MCI9317418.1 polysaccharide pyruvyl transferase CsaB [Oscillospiraceae bacterium]
MYNILISGYYGFNNIGDESILRTVIDNLREKLPDVDITVLSQSPAQTSEKYGVKAARRMSLWDILRSVWRCDLLLSGGGSLLQDATSGRSILYYLFILRLAQLLRKQTFIYSQGIGPISAPRNRRLTASVLRRADGIVVRDARSRDLLLEIGVPARLVHVTADPVIRVKKPDPALGLEILAREGCPREPGRLTVGWAVKSRKPNKAFLQEVGRCILWLRESCGADSVLIPFFHDEDVGVCEAVAARLDGKAGCLRQKYLSEETLSIIGCMDVMVGVRLHSLIYAAVMGVPMIGVSYDPKVDSFLSSIQRPTHFTVEDFTLEGFQAAFRETMENREAICETTARRLEELISKLDQNEDLIRGIMEQAK